VAFQEEHLVFIRQAVSELDTVRVGKENEAAALELEGIEPLSFTGRKMGGMVDISDAVICNATRMSAILELAVDFVGGLPSK
jgi:hypothetical protein